MNTSLWSDFRGLLRVPAVPLLFAYRALMMIGMWMSMTITLPLLVFEFNATPIQMGILLPLLGAPLILFGPYFGALADRRSPLALMLGGALYRAITILGLAFAPTLEVFVICMFFQAWAGSTFAADAVVNRRLLNAQQIIVAVSVTRVMDQSIKLATPLVTAALLWFSAAQDAYLLVSALSAVAALLVALMILQRGWLSPDPAMQHEKTQPYVQLIRGIVSSYPRIRAALFVALVASLVMGVHSGVLLYFFKESVFPAEAYGIKMACTAAGGLLASLTVKRWLVGRDALRVIWFSTGAYCLTVLVNGLWGFSSIPLYIGPLSLLWTIGGFFFVAHVIAYVTILQTETPPEHVGKVHANCTSAILLLMEFAPMLGLAVVYLHTAAMAMMLCATVCLVLLSSKWARAPRRV